MRRPRQPAPLPSNLQKGYAIVRPLDTRTQSFGYWRPATCAETHPEGFELKIDESTDLGREQAAWLRGGSGGGRPIPAERREAGLTVFTYGGGVPCPKAAEHRTAVEREPVYVQRRTAGQPGGHRYDRADQWVDDFATHQDNLADRIRRG